MTLEVMMVACFVLCFNSAVTTMIITATVYGVFCSQPKITATRLAAASVFVNTAIVHGVQSSVIFASVSAWEALLHITVCIVCFYVYPKLSYIVASLEESSAKEQNSKVSCQTLSLKAEKVLVVTKERTLIPGDEFVRKDTTSKDHFHKSVQRVVTCRKPYTFHYFTEDLIQAFESQRKHFRYQFAVLFVMSIREIKERTFHFKSRNGTATNRHITPFPLDDEIVNYVTAGPNSRHAEDLLMDKLHILMERFKDHSHPEIKCKMIVLYTWLLPCDNCKDIIIEKMWPLTKDSEVMLAYTYSKDDEDAIVRELESAGLLVRKEKYDHVLPAWEPEPLYRESLTL